MDINRFFKQLGTMLFHFCNCTNDYPKLFRYGRYRHSLQPSYTRQTRHYRRHQPQPKGHHRQKRHQGGHQRRGFLPSAQVPHPGHSQRHALPGQNIESTAYAPHPRLLARAKDTSERYDLAVPDAAQLLRTGRGRQEHDVVADYHQVCLVLRDHVGRYGQEY